jgi:hypothetical protein
MELSAKQRRAFLANMASLREKYPGLHARVSGAAAGVFSNAGRPSGGSSSGGFVIETAKDGGFTLRKDRAYLESRFEPERNALAYLRDAHGAGATIGASVAADVSATVLFLGCGLGYHINALMRGENRPREGFPWDGSPGDEDGGNAGRFILVERETAVFSAALSVLEPDLFPRLLPLVGLDEDDVLGRLEDLAPGRLAVVRHPHSTRLHARYYAGIENGILSRLKGALASSVTERANRRLWVKNILRNVHALKGRCRGTSGFAKAFSGPVTLAASGPRLEDAVGALRDLRGRMPLLALLPSYPFLHAEGIEPDLLVTTDAGFWNRLRLVSGVRIPLISTWSAEPVLLRSWAGELALFSHGLPLEDGLRGLKAFSLVVPMQGTASAVMIQLARAMGFGEIYLAGFDFAYRGMKDHHQGAGFDGVLLASSDRFRSWHTRAAARFRLEPFVPARDQSGERVYTSRKLLLYRDWIEKELAGDDLVRVTGGAAIRGVRALPREPAGEFGSLAVEFRNARGGQAFGTALRELMTDGFPPGALEEEAGAVLGHLPGREDLRSVYGFFFGAPLAGVPESEIEQDAQWALGELGRRWNRRWDR